MPKSKALTALDVQRITKAGLHADGNNLYLQVSVKGAKSWIFRYRAHGRLRDMGLGSLHAVSLKQAREKAAKLLSQRADGHDPIDTRRAERASRAAGLQGATFTACAEAFIAGQAPAWKSAKHAAQWCYSACNFDPLIGVIGVQN